MSYDIPGLVETSNNLATISTGGDEVVIGLSTRSSIASALKALRERIRSDGGARRRLGRGERSVSRLEAEPRLEAAGRREGGAPAGSSAWSRR